MTNFEIEHKLSIIQKHLSRSDLLGFAAARNSRLFSTELSEYLEKKDELIKKYGQAEIDSSGNPTGRYSIKIDSVEYETLYKELEPWGNADINIDYFKLKYSDIAGLISGNEILEIDWMLED